MGTDLVTVLKKFEEFKAEAKYWFQCHNIPVTPLFDEQVAEVEKTLKELGLYKGPGLGVGLDSAQESGKETK